MRANFPTFMRLSFGSRMVQVSFVTRETHCGFIRTLIGRFYGKRTR